MTATISATSMDLLTITDLSVRFQLRDSVVQAVSGINLTVAPGELLAVVGESGCGKSVLAHALLGLLPANATVTGQAILRGNVPADRLTTDTSPGHPGADSSSRQDATVPGRRGADRLRRRGDGAPGVGAVELIGAKESDLARTVRGRRIGLVPQSPATALTPVRTGRHLLAETLHAHGRSRSSAGTVAAGVGLKPADLDLYPHELSGGMAQRLATALALASDPQLLLADEPTSGLDRPLVDATLDLLRARCDAGGAVILITHDLAAAQRVADTVAVMYASRTVEHRPAADFFAGPLHPYAHALLDALPERAFAPIPGHPPMLTALLVGCAFAPRCPAATANCDLRPTPAPAGGGRVACHHPIGAGT